MPQVIGGAHCPASFQSHTGFRQGQGLFLKSCNPTALIMVLDAFQMHDISMILAMLSLCLGGW
jgi:hypothetical protein